MGGCVNSRPQSYQSIEDNHHLPVPTRIDPLSTINIVKVKGNEYSSNSTPSTTSLGSLRSSNGILITQYISPQFEKTEASSRSGLLKNIEVQDTSNGNSNKAGNKNWYHSRLSKQEKEPLETMNELFSDEM
jgi:hypothetical protein